MPDFIQLFNKVISERDNNGAFSNSDTITWTIKTLMCGIFHMSNARNKLHRSDTDMHTIALLNYLNSQKLMAKLLQNFHHPGNSERLQQMTSCCSSSYYLQEKGNRERLLRKSLFMAVIKETCFIDLAAVNVTINR